ncbi:MAG: hypothetical protein OXE49_19100 [Gemmatimonadetes bacterium]|nr:hypothetical protein [Gemmatimonadota bacterium]
MRSLTFSLIAWALTACGDRGMAAMLTPCEPEPWPDWQCASAKLATACPPRMLEPDTVCPEILFHLVSWALNEPNWNLLIFVIAPDFTFVDETTGLSTQGIDHEMTVADSLLDCYYRGAEFDFNIASRTQQGICQKVCGMVFMRVYHTDDVGLIINDQTCMTTCPNEDGFWRLTEWRILRSVPPAQPEEGFEGATWGEARRRRWEKNFCRSPP